jgi:hypothetical protein
MSRRLLFLAFPACAALVVASVAATGPPSVRDLAPMAALWERPADLRSQDLFTGPWGGAYAPDPRAVYTFVRPKDHGANPGVVVRDPSGRIWHVKTARNDLGAEGPVEVVVSRILSAVGYHQPPVYFLPSFTMTDSAGRTRLQPGGRFRLDEPSLRHVGSWSWENNPFVGTQPFEGLLVILLMFNSWDLKDSNNSLYEVQDIDGVHPWYVVRDLGGALGETGHLRPQRNNIGKFEHQTFITGVTGRFVEFAYGGKQANLVRQRLTVDDVRWASDLVGGLSDGQWHDAFRAGGYAAAVTDRFIRKLQANVAQGQRLENEGWPVQERR